jgi:glyoxylate/hydroxypyruvate reductase
LRDYREADAYAAAQRAEHWRQRPRIAKSAFGIGILGFGVLGAAVANALMPFGFPISAWSRTRKSAPGIVSYSGPAELPALLAASRVLVCLLPSTPATRGLLDRDALDGLPRGAHLINVARGEIVVDEDLIAALDAGRLSAATLDVFREEPLPASHPFWHHPRITLTPHRSAVTLVDDSVAQIAAKIRRLERGESVTGVVDRARGY